MSESVDFEKEYSDKVDECMDKLVEFINANHYHPSVWCAALSNATYINLIQGGCDKSRIADFYKGVMESVLDDLDQEQDPSDKKQ